MNERAVILECSLTEMPPCLSIGILSARFCEEHVVQSKHLTQDNIKLFVGRESQGRQTSHGPR